MTEKTPKHLIKFKCINCGNLVFSNDMTDPKCDICGTENLIELERRKYGIDSFNRAIIELEKLEIKRIQKQILKKDHKKGETADTLLDEILKKQKTIRNLSKFLGMSDEELLEHEEEIEALDKE